MISVSQELSTSLEILTLSYFFLGLTDSKMAIYFEHLGYKIIYFSYIDLHCTLECLQLFACRYCVDIVDIDCNK